MSTQSESPPIPAALRMAIEVERSLRDEQIGTFFVMPRVVRRVLQSELDIASPWQPPPHRKCCVIPRDRLLWLVARDELGVEPNTRLPDTVILIAEPEEDQLAVMSREELERYYWRLMFHARIDFVMLSLTAAGRMSMKELRRRVDQLGQTAFDEIRSVLRAEQMLMRSEDDRNVYAEFVAVYHEFTAFAPELLPLYFPSLASREEVMAVIAPDCDAAALLKSTRPSGLPQSDDANSDKPIAQVAVSKPSPAIEPTRPRSARHAAGLIRRAEKLSVKENNVRAALILQKAVDASPPEVVDRTTERFHEEIQRLVSRLQSALELSEQAVSPWFTMCAKLLPGAQHGFWNANARLLYDLQKVCFDHEHEIYKVDLLRWMMSAGKSPLKSPLSNQRVVMMSKHLRAATLRVPYVEIDRDGRRELSQLLHEAADAAEHILRFRIEPLIEKALLDAGFFPASVVERVASKKLVGELADSVVDRGFITLGSLRDAVSRNQLKMPDLKDAREFFSGDQLLRGDRLLAASLDGVYTRGAFYLRWLQRANSLAFGIPWGRLFTRYVALPFGLSFMLLKTIDVAVDHLPFHRTPAAVTESASIPEASLIANEIGQTTDPSPLPAHVAAQTQHPDIIYSHTAMFLLGCVFFALIHFPTFRRRVVWVMAKLWILTRILFFDIPRAVLRWRLIDRFFKSFPMMLFRRFVLAPLLVTAVFWAILPELGFYSELNRWWGLSIFLFSFLVLNSRVGRDTEELAREFFSRTWYRIRDHLVMGLFTLIVDIFKTLMDWLERVLYAVDEWLRFRSGESRLTLGIKAVVGLIWAFIHGVIRFCVTLLIEPQLNPIKHFPVVTVSHKLVWAALFFPIFNLLERVFEKPATAYTVTTLILFIVPGVFGFLAWELKENWKLYKANRSPKLKPVLIGDHGETLLRLLCPGFHSGTIPRLFAKQRRAARRESKSLVENKHAKFLERLHHEAVAVRHFIERELIALLNESRTFHEDNIFVRHVEFTTNRVLITIEDAALPELPLILEFAEQSGWLVGVIRQPGWMKKLQTERSETLQVALTGVYKLAAVDLVREQIERQLTIDVRPSNSEPDQHGVRAIHPYDIGSSGLIVWPNRAYATEIHFPLDEEPVTHPRPRSVARAAGITALAINDLVFQRNEVTWVEWQRFWENEQNLSAHSVAGFPFRW